jgi:hypothetical protein
MRGGAVEPGDCGFEYWGLSSRSVGRICLFGLQGGHHAYDEAARYGVCAVRYKE